MAVIYLDLHCRSCSCWLLLLTLVHCCSVRAGPKCRPLWFFADKKIYFKLKTKTKLRVSLKFKRKSQQGTARSQETTDLKPAEYHCEDRNQRRQRETRTVSTLGQRNADENNQGAGLKKKNETQVKYTRK